MSSLHKYPLISFRGNYQLEWFGRHAILTEEKVTYSLARPHKQIWDQHGEAILKSAGTILNGGFDNYIHSLTQTH